MADNYVIGADVAQKQLSAMEEEFGELEKSQRPTMLDAIMRGLVDFDAAEASVTYKLQRPIEQKNGDTLTHVTLIEPTIEQLQRITRGQMVKLAMDRQAEFSVESGYAELVKLLSVVAGVPEGVAMRIKRRDVAVLQALQGFFG